VSIDHGTAIEALLDEGARFVVVRGVALTLHGSAYVTFDLDVAIERTRENTMNVARALRRFDPRPRGFPDDVPFIFDAQSILSAQTLTLGTTIGDIDLLGEISGVGAFAEIDRRAQDVAFRRRTVRVLSIDALIDFKRAANRPKDVPGLLELAALKEIRAAATGDEQSLEPAD
jgi:hypothetical protein